MAPQKITLKSGAIRWQVRWRDPNGKQRAKNLVRQDKAILLEAKYKVDKHHGDMLDPDLGKITLNEWFEKCLRGARNLRPRSVQTYREAWVRIGPALGWLPLDQASDSHIDDYLSSLEDEGLTGWTVHRHYRTLRWVFRRAVTARPARLRRSPIDGVTEPALPEEEMAFLDGPGQLEDLADAIDRRYRTFILVKGWGGPRYGEMAGLKVRRVDVERSRIQILVQRDQSGKRESAPKSKKGKRWVSIPRSVMDELAEEIKDNGPDDLVWTAPKGGPMHYSDFLNRFFQPAAVKAGLGTFTYTEDEYGKTHRHYGGVKPHTLRHTSVALAIAEGAHPKAIQERLGDASIQVTLDRYGHLFPEMDATIGERLDATRSKTLTERRAA